MLFSLLWLLLVCSAQASHFYGTVMTFYPKNTNADGTVTVVLRYKLGFETCSSDDTWDCRTGDCGTQTSLVLNTVIEISGEWCQREGIMTRQITSNAPFELQLDGGNWINGIRNGITFWRALTLVDLRIRSDTGRANTSPQTTILPALRVPSNCPRDFNLLAFDPDGDEVECRYGNTSTECNPCTLPSVLSLSTSCTLSFSQTSSSDEGAYAVQLVMEDFPGGDIALTKTDGVQTMISSSTAISKLPVQFVLRVDPVVPSCTEGLYLPMFLPPTPANRAQLYTPVNQAVEITISASASNSMISKLLFSGPHNINLTNTTGLYTLTWTPSENEDGESHPVCFVAEAKLNTSKYHSELRCVIVTVGNDPRTTTTSLPTTTPVATTTITTTLTTTTILPTTTTTTTIPPTTTTTTTIPPTTTTTTTIPPTTTTTTTIPLTTTTTTTIPPTTTTTTTIPPTTTTATTTIPATTTATTTIPPTTTTATTIPPTTTTTTIPPTTTTTTTIPPTTTTATTTIPPTTTTATTIPLTTTTITIPPTTTTTTTIPPTTTTIPPTTTTTTTIPPTTTTLTTTTIPPTTTTIPPTTTTTTTIPPMTTTIPPTTTTTTTIPPTTTTLTTTTIPPTTTTIPPTTTTTTTIPPTTTTTTTIPPTTTTLTTTTIPPTTTTIPPTTTTLTTTTISPMITTLTTTTIPPTTTTTTTIPQTTTTNPPTTTTTTTVPPLITTTTIIPPTTTMTISPTTTTPTQTGPSSTTTPTTSPSSPPPTITPAPETSDRIIVGLRVKLSSTTPLSEDFIRSTIIQQIRDELLRQGLPPEMTLGLVSILQTD